MPFRVDADRVEDVTKVERAELVDHEKHREQKSDVADAVDDERFFAGVRGGVALEVEADEQVGGETDTLPADEHEKKILRQHQDRHEEHEEVEISKESPIPLFM